MHVSTSIFLDFYDEKETVKPIETKFKKLIALKYNYIFSLKIDLSFGFGGNYYVTIS